MELPHAGSWPGAGEGGWLSARGGGQSVPGLGLLPGLVSLPNPALPQGLLGETGGDRAQINLVPHLLQLHSRLTRPQRKMKVAVLSVALLLAILCHPADAKVSPPSWAQAEGWRWGWAAGGPSGQAYFALFGHWDLNAMWVRAWLPRSLSCLLLLLSLLPQVALRPAESSEVALDQVVSAHVAPQVSLWAIGPQRGDLPEISGQTGLGFLPQLTAVNSLAKEIRSGEHQTSLLCFSLCQARGWQRLQLPSFGYPNSPHSPCPPSPTLVSLHGQTSQRSLRSSEVMGSARAEPRGGVDSKTLGLPNPTSPTPSHHH